MDIEELLGQSEGDVSPSTLRRTAVSLLRLADAMDQNWNPDKVRSNYPMFSRASRIERNAIALSRVATQDEHRARVREEAIGLDIVGIPAWNILLELFRQFAGGAKVSTKSLQIISRCPETTALRIIDRLESRGLVTRAQSDADKRVTFITLTRDGVVKVGSVLENLGD